MSGKTIDVSETSPLHIRPARIEEWQLLTDICFRAKAYWGYPSEYMELWRDLMIVTPERINHDHYFVAEEAGLVLGYVALRRIDEERVELDDLFIAPEAIGRGIGRKLWAHGLCVAREFGFRLMEWDADPFAEPFYRHMGAEGIGFTQSALLSERILPRMRIELGD